MLTYIHRISDSLKSGGLIKTCKKITNVFFRELLISCKIFYLNIFKVNNFYFGKYKCKYFYHRYNKTYDNERIIEIPIILKLISEFKITKYFELGNVLHNYGITGHSVVDKYDAGNGVIRQDIINYRPNKRIENLISISTLEHIGWDEGERTIDKIKTAFDNILNNILVSGGYFIFTAPVGYNPFLDQYLVDNKYLMTAVYSLIRSNIDNEWIETPFEECINKRFGSPYPNANGMVIGVIQAR